MYQPPGPWRTGAHRAASGIVAASGRRLRAANLRDATAWPVVFSASGRGLRVFLLVLALAAPVRAEPGSSPLAAAASTSDAVELARRARAILSDKCFQCHGPDAKQREADLRLDTREGLYQRRESAAVVVPGQPENSLLWRRITASDEERMPPPDTGLVVRAEERAVLRQWIAAGAPFAEHWAFTPIRRPRLPSVKDNRWCRNAIDRFVLARLEAVGRRPSVEADRRKLIRRVTLDLLGRPPSLDELDAFLADDRLDAYERLVDRLLASPQYGERMAWEWLEAARYADTNGYQGDPTRTMWPWRDVLVAALNANQPFDRFTIEQLAGDLLPGATLEQVVASGFNRNHMFNGEGGRIPEETRVENVFDRTETTATVWLGLTFTCARCHDHKYDPVSRRDYYRFFAFFNNTSETGAGRSGQIPPVVDYFTPDQRYLLVRLEPQLREQQETLRVLEQTIRARLDLAASTSTDELSPSADGTERSSAPGMASDATDSSRTASAGKKGRQQAAAEANGPDDAARPLTPLSLPAGVKKVLVQLLGKPPEKRSPEELRKTADALEETLPEYARRLREYAAVRERHATLARPAARVMVMDELPPGKRRKTFMLTKGIYNKPEEEVTAGVPGFLPPLPEDEPRNRLALARWLVRPDNPLTARVVVNRYWQLFFGTGLVKTAEDFGSQGEPPSHPLLLDWLAREFIDSGWDVKHIHRLIVTSATYRQSSARRPGDDFDPENRLLARGPRYRWPSWMLRDQALFVSGLLVSELGGPPVRPYQPAGVWADATFGKIRYQQDHGPKLYRRSLYVFWRRIVGPTMFFDVAKRQTCTVRIARTNSPLHALVLWNETGYVEAAWNLAQRLLTEVSGDDAARLRSAWLRMTCREPSPEETSRLLARLEHLRRHFARHRKDAERLVAVGESPRDPTLDVVEHAAWTALCNTLLNLDEVLSKE